jgi:predicted RNase H-like HicB family nuclease
LPGCIAVGETETEALALIEEAIQFHLEDMKAGGLQIPPPASKSTFVEVPLAA